MRLLRDEGWFAWGLVGVTALLLLVVFLCHSPTYGDWLERDVRILQRELPADLPVVVLTENTPGAFASTSMEDVDGDGWADRYVIRIDPGRGRTVAEDCLVHEWAHTLSWEEEEDHGDDWGMAYALVYRTLLKSEAETSR